MNITIVPEYILNCNGILFGLLFVSTVLIIYLIANINRFSVPDFPTEGIVTLNATCIGNMQTSHKTIDILSTNEYKLHQ